MHLLIVTADDFGISHGINRGVIEAHRRGILTSTSLLVNRPAAEQAAALGRAYPALSIGLHLELDPDGPPPPSVPTELERQLARFVQLVGTAPTHVDSHHDVHRDPRVLPHVRAWARRVGVPVRGYSRIHHFSKFYGQWGGESHPEQIGVPGLLRLLDAAFTDGKEEGGGVTELTCHPGYVEPGFTSSYAVEREIELRTLCASEVRQALEERGIRLIGFRDLPPTAWEDAA